MQTHYSPEYPLGFNSNPRSPEIPFYLSWAEMAEITRTGIYTDVDGKKYTMADAKEHRPLITYKGNFGTKRSNDTFTGTRSPYVAVDIDIEQSASGMNKYNLTEEQKVKVESDMEVMLSYLSDKRDFFFCKRSTSGCGWHIVVKLDGVPDDKIPLYEREIIYQFNKVLKEMGGLYYKYTADPAMMKLSQPLGLSIDEKVIYNPGRVTPAATYTPKQEYGEQLDGKQLDFGQRLPHRLDRLNFIRFSNFCRREQKRLPYEDIFRLSILFMMLWPDAKVEQYIDMCSGLNEYRAKEQGENNIKFLTNEYKKVKKAVNKSYNGSVLGINSLYYIMDKYSYCYKPDKEIRFTGYLKNVEPELKEVLNTHPDVLIKAPTGSGKTKTVFDYLKEEARKNPTKNYVLALPYISMVEQFSLENSDDEFQIGILSGDEKADKEFSKIKKKQKKKPKKKSVPQKPVEVIQGNLFEDAKKVSGEKRRNLWCSTYDSAIRIWNIHTLVIDESHNMVAQIEFRPEAMEALANVRCRKKIRITATPEMLLPETLEGTYYVSCIKEDAVKPKLRIERVKGSLAVAVKNHIVGKSSSLTFWNHKQECSRLSNILLRNGISASCYNRDKSKEAHQKKLQQEGMLSTHALATCFISEGVNVLNDNVETINIVDDYSITNIRQAAARPRKCVPEINLILRETEYEPGVWMFSPVKKFIAELARLEVIADKLNELRAVINRGQDENMFAAFKDDEDFIYYNTYQHRFMVRENRVKAAIMERYKHWLYHKKRELWMAELGKYFDIVEDKVTDNNGKNEKKTEQPFEVFKATSHDLICEFRAHKIKVADGRRRRKEPYTPEMVEWAAAHNHLELTPEWERWTERYLKMLEYRALDYDTVKSGHKFCYWQRRADMLVSVREGGYAPKDVRITETNNEVMSFLLSQDYSEFDLSKPELYQMAKNHIKKKGLKPIVLKGRPFWNIFTHLLKVEVRQKKSTGKRYVRSVTRITNDVPYTTGKLERLEREAANAEEREAIDKFLGVGRTA